MITQLSTFTDSLTVDVIPVWLLSAQVASDVHIFTGFCNYNLAKQVVKATVCNEKGTKDTQLRDLMTATRLECCLVETSVHFPSGPSVCLSVCRLVSLSDCLSVCLLVSLSVCLSLNAIPSVCMSVCPSVWKVWKGSVAKSFRALDLKSGGPWFNSSTLPLLLSRLFVLLSSGSENLESICYHGNNHLSFFPTICISLFSLFSPFYFYVICS